MRPKVVAQVVLVVLAAIAIPTSLIAMDPVGIGIWLLGCACLGAVWLMSNRARRRAQRTQRMIEQGACPVCLYQLDDLPVCPECGTPRPEHDSSGA